MRPAPEASALGMRRTSALAFVARVPDQQAEKLGGTGNRGPHTLQQLRHIGKAAAVGDLHGSELRVLDDGREDLAVLRIADQFRAPQRHLVALDDAILETLPRGLGRPAGLRN